MDVYVLPETNECSKCGKPVPPNNDVVFLDIERGSFLAVAAPSRHLLPVIENGVTVCEGSPSRAQYLEGQPRDTRAEYAYRPEHEKPTREAYQRMLASVRETPRQ